MGMDFEPVLATTTTGSSDRELEAVRRLARGLHLEQRLNDSTASECSSTLASCEFADPPIYTTGMITPTWPTNPGLNFESNLNTPLNLLNHAVRDGGLNAGTNTTSDAHGGTPKQQISFDNAGGSGSFATTRSVDQAFSRLQARGSDPIPSSPALRTSDRHDPNWQGGRTSQPRADSELPTITINLPFRSPSPSHSPSRPRAASPLPEEKFEPVNPFKWLTQIWLSWCRCCPSTSSPRDLDLETDAGPGPDAISGPGTSTSPSSSSSNGPYNGGDLNLTFINVTSIKSFCEAAPLFVSDTLRKLVYHNFLLLSLPAMYSSRVSKMAGLEFDSQGGREGRGGVGVDSASGTAFHGGSVERVYLPGSSGHQGRAGVLGEAPNAFDSWEAFIESLPREWKTLNVVSAVLTSAIMALLQVPEASDDPITRSTALLSFICALMSLSCGYIYIMRLGTIRSMYRASNWAEEVKRTDTAIWWNVWVLLAMPAVWMSWSMLLFLASILSFVWRTGLGTDPSSRAPLGTTAVLGPRVAITGVLGLGLAYLAMIVKTLMYDREWGGMRADEEMRIGMNSDAVSVPGERGRERGERDRDRVRDGERSTRRRGGGTDRHLAEA